MEKNRNYKKQDQVPVHQLAGGAHDDRVQTHGVLRLERGAGGREEDAAHQDAYEVAF